MVFPTHEKYTDILENFIKTKKTVIFVSQFLVLNIQGCNQKWLRSCVTEFSNIFRRPWFWKISSLIYIVNCQAKKKPNYYDA